jgi:hypothetical protein
MVTKVRLRWGLLAPWPVLLCCPESFRFVSIPEILEKPLCPELWLEPRALEVVSLFP